MINYIIAECYRVLQKKSLIFFLITVFLVDFILIIFFYDNEIVKSIEVIIAENVIVGNGIIMFTLYPADIIWIDEFKNKTIKNTLSYGITKKTIFFAKSITTLLLTLAFNLIESSYCILIQLIVYKTNDAISVESLLNLLIKFLTCIPLITSVTLFTIIITLLVKKINWVIAICLSSFLSIELGNVIDIIKGNYIIDALYKLMPNANLNFIVSGSKYGGKVCLDILNISEIGYLLMLGIIYTTIFAYIGYIIYDKVVL